MLRRVAIAASAWILLACPAIGQQSADPLRSLMSNVHQDMITCVAYFRVVSNCVANTPQRAELAAKYGKVADDLLDKAFLLGRETKISDDAQISRMKLAVNDMMGLMQRDCTNISSLLSRYMDRCTAVANDPLKPLMDAVQGK
jgi:hypothetical protein